MSPPGRPKGEYRSAKREGNPLTPPGRPKGEYRSAKREGNPLTPPGRPKDEYRSAKREGNPLTPPGRPKDEYRSAKREGNPLTPSGRPKGEYRSAQHEGSPVSRGRPISAGHRWALFRVQRAHRGVEISRRCRRQFPHPRGVGRGSKGRRNPSPGMNCILRARATRGGTAPCARGGAPAPRGNRRIHSARGTEMGQKLPQGAEHAGALSPRPGRRHCGVPYGFSVRM